MTTEPFSAPPSSPTTTPGWAHEPSQDGQQPVRPGRSWRKPVAIAAALAAVAFGGAFAANNYAKSRICDSLRSVAASSGQTGQSETGGLPNAAGLRKEVGKAKAATRVLVFDGDLRNAVDSLAADADRLSSASEALQKAAPADKLAMLPQMMSVAGNTSKHVRDAQRACGQPETGIPGL